MNALRKTTLTAVGIAAIGVASITQVQAAHFQYQELESGYKMSEPETDKTKKEAKCGEGKCAADMKTQTTDKAKKTKMSDKAKKEAKCGEAKCGTSN